MKAVLDKKLVDYMKEKQLKDIVLYPEKCDT